MGNLYDKVQAILKKDSRFLSEDGEILRNAVYEATMKMDADLIKALYNDIETRDCFFTDVEGIAVFDKVGFSWLINNKEFLPSSYTRYKNKIGLVNEKEEYISSSKNVELVFPYKDCVLEGGQTKDENKREEIFWNKILAPNDVDRLLCPKVMVNVSRFNAEEEKTVNEFSDDSIFVKGNNLLVITSLLKKYEGKIKLIYIDPPYNTESDTFSYNDKFSRSAWLTFMKNRLEIAKRLLSPEGAIYVQLDYHQVHYAKVLMDEVFGEENFQREIIWRIGWISGYKSADNNWIRNHDTILFYSKNNNSLTFKKSYIPREEFKKIADSDAE